MSAPAPRARNPERDFIGPVPVRDPALLAAARAEYDRRHDAWAALVAEAKRESRDDERRAIERATADLMLWHETVEWLRIGLMPADIRRNAASARQTVRGAIEADKPAQADALSPLARTLDRAARWHTAHLRDREAAPEMRKAA